MHCIIETKMNSRNVIKERSYEYLNGNEHFLYPLRSILAQIISTNIEKYFMSIGRHTKYWFSLVKASNSAPSHPFPTICCYQYAFKPEFHALAACRGLVSTPRDGLINQTGSSARGEKTVCVVDQRWWTIANPWKWSSHFRASFFPMILDVSRHLGSVKNNLNDAYFTSNIELRENMTRLNTGPLEETL